MKKILSLILALAMVMSLSVTAFAADTSSKTGIGNGGTATIDIAATYQEGSAADDVISVDVSWGSMTFQYTDGAEGKWDPATHTNAAKGDGTWTASDNAITVTNHSNTGIKATFTYAKAVDTVTGTFSQDSITLATAVGTVKDEAPSDSVTLTLGGTLTAETAGKVGTVTVAIAKNS